MGKPKSQAGKGDGTRPIGIPQDDWDENWKLAFRKAKKNPGKWTAVHPKWKTKQEKSDE